jgi:hypothetical protein
MAIETIRTKCFVNNFFNWLYKYSHILFLISRYLKIKNNNDSLKCQQDIEKLLDNEKIGLSLSYNLQLLSKSGFQSQTPKPDNFGPPTLETVQFLTLGWFQKRFSIFERC